MKFSYSLAYGNETNHLKFEHPSGPAPGTGSIPRS